MTECLVDRRPNPKSRGDTCLENTLVSSATVIHQLLGPDLLESIYVKCFCYELNKRNISFTQKAPVSRFAEEGPHPEETSSFFLVEDSVIVMIRASESLDRDCLNQLSDHLESEGKQKGYIFNFRMPQTKDVIKGIFREIGYGDFLRGD
ncbi:MAG TPA: GxxExxY protein [Puia sp.]|nr:GxxExxY protein [Puia sp.]